MFAVIFINGGEYSARIIGGDDLGAHDGFDDAVESIRLKLLVTDEPVARAIVLKSTSDMCGKIKGYSYQLQPVSKGYIRWIRQDWSKHMEEGRESTLDEAISYLCDAAGSMVIRRAKGINWLIANHFGDHLSITHHLDDDDVFGYFGTISWASEVAECGFSEYRTTKALRDDEIEMLALRDWCAANGIEHQMPAKYVDFLARNPFKGVSG